MAVAQSVLEAAEETENPVDFYAGISALCVVILFAKFNTHGARKKKPAESAPKTEAERETESEEPKKTRRKREFWRISWRGVRSNLWSGLHISCILFAWFAIAVSLFVLGWGDASESYEFHTRWIAAGLAGVASIILALDVFNQR